MCRSGEAERGQALPILLVALAVALIAIAVVARVGVVADDRARAQTAADAAALAGAAGGRSEAARLARANGAALVDYRASGATVVVVVVVGDASARASAESVVEWGPSGGAGSGDQ